MAVWDVWDSIRVHFAVVKIGRWRRSLCGFPHDLPIFVRQRIAVRCINFAPFATNMEQHSSHGGFMREYEV